MLLRLRGSQCRRNAAPQLEFRQHLPTQIPDLTARTNKPIAQLAIYALALTRLVPGLKLFDMKCAWFNEDEYLEFFARTLFATKQG